ncbi:MAG TPA: L,D-transpeptidase [Acidimicrobiales bacterium]|nr:L,D-transpeptidase [Acidimicrobiales bacterium]
MSIVRRVVIAATAALVLLAGCAGSGNGDEGALDAESVRSMPDVGGLARALDAPTTTAGATLAGTAESVASIATTTPPLAPLAPWQVLVAIVRPEVTLLALFDGPDGRAVNFELAMVNPWYFGGELALLVTSGRETDAWLQVALPTRPNGTTAWIRASDVTLRTHRVHAEIALGTRRLRVWDADSLLVDTGIVVGKASTPTPFGHFFVNARIEHANAGGAYGPWILSLSGFSEVLDTFDGGLPELAIHGTNQPGLIGQARSNGCIRVHNDVIRKLAEVVPLGTPVDIVA